MARGNRADGTIDHPYSALNLRLLLALFGVVSMFAIAMLAWSWGIRPVAAVALVMAGVAAVNAAVVQRRRVERRRRERGADHSLFE